MKHIQQIRIQSCLRSSYDLMLVPLCLLAGGVLGACGSSSDAGFSAGQQGPAGGSGGAAAVTAGAGGMPQAGNAGDTTSAAGNGGSLDASGSGGTVAGGPASGGAMSLAGSSGAAQAGTGGSGGACSSADACTSCLCNQCPAQVKTCEGTPGCQAIADCVATSKCSGAACYCGTSDTLTCIAGTADGPCRDVILKAPGGRKPTVDNQSAGPAADAATAVATCGAQNSACRASCQ